MRLVEPVHTRLMLVFFVLAALSGCAFEEPSTESPAESTSEAGDNLFVVWPKVWSSNAWGVHTIPVCWEEASITSTNGLSDSDFNKAKGWVRDAVEKTWSNTANVVFTGWGLCTASSSGIRIHVNDNPDWKTDAQGQKTDTGSEDHPHVKAFGNALNGMKNGMLLNFTYKNFSPSCAATRESCDRWIAVHEFGHALGYAHEQDRDDRDTDCTLNVNTGTGTWKVGAWDLNGVMNYCSPDTYSCGRAADGAKLPCTGETVSRALSPTDIMGHQMTYGRKHGGTLVDSQGHCLTLNNGKLEQWDCMYMNQAWQFQPIGGAIVSTTAQGQCVKGSGVSGAVVVPAQCSSSDSAQTWAMSAFEIRGVGNACVTQSEDTYTILWECTYPEFQTFNMQGNQIKRGGSCLDTKNSWYPFFAACDGASPYQSWTLLAGGRLRNNAYPDYCLSAKTDGVLGAVTTNGAYMELATCGEEVNASNVHQRFHLAGRVSTSGMSLLPQSSSNGSANRMSSAAPVWQFYP